eukprot:145098_1
MLLSLLYWLMVLIWISSPSQSSSDSWSDSSSDSIEDELKELIEGSYSGLLAGHNVIISVCMGSDGRATNGLAVNGGIISIEFEDTYSFKEASTGFDEKSLSLLYNKNTQKYTLSNGVTLNKTSSEAQLCLAPQQTFVDAIPILGQSPPVAEEIFPGVCSGNKCVEMSVIGSLDEDQCWAIYDTEENKFDYGGGVENNNVYKWDGYLGIADFTDIRSDTCDIGSMFSIITDKGESYYTSFKCAGIDQIGVDWYRSMKCDLDVCDGGLQCPLLPEWENTAKSKYSNIDNDFGNGDSISILIHLDYNTSYNLWIMLIIFFVVNGALISYFYFCGDKKRV